MSLPDVIAIDPLSECPQAKVIVPGSKSLTNRALIIAALGPGLRRIDGALWSDDTRVMVECLRTLGFSIDVFADPDEPGNRSIEIVGQGGEIPPGGTEDEPLSLFVGNAGTAARFLMAFLCLGSGVYRLQGIDRMHERPQAGLVVALRELGYRVETENSRLPVLIHGGGAREGGCRVDISESSQFASALLLSGESGSWTVDFGGKKIEESPYVNMTVQLIRAMNESADPYQIEPDASSGSYFWAVNGLGLESSSSSSPSNFEQGGMPGVSVAHWPTTGWQIDAAFPRFLGSTSPVSRERDLGDSIMTAIVLAAAQHQPRTFHDLARLRVQECERVAALRTELSKCGIRVVEAGESLTIQPGPIGPALIDTYDDHRVAMCFSILALKAAGLRIKDPSCVKKTFPNFFQKLAAKTPNGLGVTIRDAASMEILTEADLMAE